jgi:hypothetical protein
MADAKELWLMMVDNEGRLTAVPARCKDAYVNPPAGVKNSVTMGHTKIIADDFTEEECKLYAKFNWREPAPKSHADKVRAHEMGKPESQRGGPYGQLSQSEYVPYSHHGTNLP